MNPRYFLPTLSSITVMVLLVFAVLKWLDIPAGHLVDWVIGVAMFWWLMAITTIPWNLYFSAREAVNEAAVSQQRGIQVEQTDVRYATQLARNFLRLSIALHIITAGALYLLAYYQITALGAWAAGASLLLTFLRPLHRLYEHIASRLASILHRVRYPREDVVLALGRIEDAESRLRDISDKLDLDTAHSWAGQLDERLEQIDAKLQQLHLTLDEALLQNAKEHERLSRKVEQDIAKLSEDAQFLNQVRELVRFIKHA